MLPRKLQAQESTYKVLKIHCAQESSVGRYHVGRSESAGVFLCRQVSSGGVRLVFEVEEVLQC